MNDVEMISWLKQIEKDIFVCSLESTFAEDAKSCAIHEAISALQTQLKESSENFNKDSAQESMLNADLISRQAAVSVANDFDATMVVRGLEKLPSIQPEQKVDWTCIDKLKAKSYSESEYGVPEFDANKVIQLSDAIEIIKDYCGVKVNK